MQNLKCIISQKLARILIQKGFIVKDIRPNRDIKNATIFLFDNTEELNRILNQFKEDGK